jgi:hypothetical protein
MRHRAQMPTRAEAAHEGLTHLAISRAVYRTSQSFGGLDPLSPCANIIGQSMECDAYGSGNLKKLSNSSPAIATSKKAWASWPSPDAGLPRSFLVEPVKVGGPSNLLPEKSMREPCTASAKRRRTGTREFSSQRTERGKNRGASAGLLHRACLARWNREHRRCRNSADPRWTRRDLLDVVRSAAGHGHRIRGGDPGPGF